MTSRIRLTTFVCRDTERKTLETVAFFDQNPHQFRARLQTSLNVFFRSVVDFQLIEYLWKILQRITTKKIHSDLSSRFYWQNWFDLLKTKSILLFRQRVFTEQYFFLLKHEIVFNSNTQIWLNNKTYIKNSKLCYF